MTSDLTDNWLHLSGETGGLAAELRGKTTADWLAELELGKVKKVGTFLDGCKIFLSGFNEAEQVRILVFVCDEVTPLWFRSSSAEC